MIYLRVCDLLEGMLIRSFIAPRFKLLTSLLPFNTAYKMLFVLVTWQRHHLPVRRRSESFWAICYLLKGNMNQGDLKL